MKIIGQSTLADGSPYMHLGYTSAVIMKIDHTLLYGGLFTFILGFFTAFTLALGKKNPGVTPLTIIRRKSKKLLAGGCVLMIVGFFAMRIALLKAETATDYIRARINTGDRGMAILDLIDGRSKNNEPIPTELEELGLSNSAILDGWNHSMRLEVVEGFYEVLSAGPDGVFGTADDFHMTSIVKQPDSRPDEREEVEK